MIPDDAVTISVFPDGDKFCAVFTDSFYNLEESDSGFGDTRLEAIKDLLLNSELEA